MTQTKTDLPLNWKPRVYQMPMYNAMMGGSRRRAACVWHRRAGKDLTCMNLTVPWMFERVGLYWHVLPNYTQGRKIVWNGMDGTGRPFRDYIPSEMISKQRDDEMMVKLKNGSIWQVVGGDNPDRLVGSNPVGIVFSEYSLHNPECWDLLRPILNENGGWAIFIYTARGHNHGYRLLRAAQDMPQTWFTEVLTVDDTRRPDGTPVITPEMIDEERRSEMPEELIRQEYYCDFSAPLVGSYFGQMLDQAHKDDRITDIPYKRELKVHTSWDIGLRDSTAIWFFQFAGDFINYIDFHQDSGIGVEGYVKVLKDKPYVYGHHYGPHDVAHGDWSTGKTKFEVAWELGIRFDVCPKLDKEEQINAGRRLLSRSRFDKIKCDKGLEALHHYRKEWDRRNRLWSSKPVHDWSSHPSDAFLTGAVGIPTHNYSVKQPTRFKENFGEMIESHVRKSRATSTANRRWI